MARKLVAPQGNWWTGAGSMYFDGVGNYVVGTNGLAAGEMSVLYSIWIPFSEATDRYPFFLGQAAVGAGFGTYRAAATDRENLGVAGGGTAYIPGQFRGLWNRVYLAKNATTTWTYGSNGRYSSTVDLAITMGNADAYLGCIFTGGMPQYFGRQWMHDFRIYSRQLTTDELKADGCGEWLGTTGLVRHWPLEQIVGGQTPERVLGTMDTVVGSVIDPAKKPWAMRSLA